MSTTPRPATVSSGAEVHPKVSPPQMGTSSKAVAAATAPPPQPVKLAAMRSS